MYIFSILDFPSGFLSRGRSALAYIHYPALLQRQFTAWKVKSFPWFNLRWIVPLKLVLRILTMASSKPTHFLNSTGPLPKFCTKWVWKPSLLPSNESSDICHCANKTSVWATDRVTEASTSPPGKVSPKFQRWLFSQLPWNQLVIVQISPLHRVTFFSLILFQKTAIWISRNWKHRPVALLRLSLLGSRARQKSRWRHLVFSFPELQRRTSPLAIPILLHNGSVYFCKGFQMIPRGLEKS